MALWMLARMAVSSHYNDWVTSPDVTPIADECLCVSFADLSESLDADLAHAKFLHLAGDRHREFIDEEKVPWHLEVRDASAKEIAQQRFFAHVTGIQPDPSHKVFAVAITRNADDIGFGYVAVL